MYGVDGRVAPVRLRHIARFLAITGRHSPHLQNCPCGGFSHFHTGSGEKTLCGEGWELLRRSLVTALRYVVAPQREPGGYVETHGFTVVVVVGLVPGQVCPALRSVPVPSAQVKVSGVGCMRSAVQPMFLMACCCAGVRSLHQMM
jgi:hypothetical protein